MLMKEELENNGIEDLEKTDNFSNFIAPEEKDSVKVKTETTKKRYEKKDLEEKLETVVETIDETSASTEETNEDTVIEKIKNFIAKIVAMQEEAQREEDELQNEKEALNKEDSARKADEEDRKYLVEYYDLPYRYNETTVKILAQTPKKLFVYWDISDNDRQKYVDTFGGDFFNKTYPVLLVYNQDKKYVKEVEINDFANSWYIDIDDPKTKYTIQLGRKLRDRSIVNMQKVYENNIILKTDYLPFADSNTLEAPNDHVLLETLPRYIIFRNVKTGEEVAKDLRKFKDIFGKKYNVKDFYNKNYKDEITDGMFDMNNPSSSSKVTSSTFK